MLQKVTASSLAHPSICAYQAKRLFQPSATHDHVVEVLDKKRRLRVRVGAGRLSMLPFGEIEKPTKKGRLLRAL